MHRIPVVSSQLASVGYDAATNTLEIEFVPGPVYRYDNVPPEVYEELVGADSKGKQFNQTIRGKFKYEKVERREPALHSMALNLKPGRYLIIYVDGTIKLVVEKPTINALSEAISMREQSIILDMVCLKRQRPAIVMCVDDSGFLDPQLPRNDKATAIFSLTRPHADSVIYGHAAIVNDADFGD